MILLGIAGLFLPFLQGVLFLVIGIGLLDFERKRRVLASGRRRLVGWGAPRAWFYPSAERRARRIEKRRARQGAKANAKAAARGLPDGTAANSQTRSP